MTMIRQHAKRHRVSTGPASSRPVEYQGCKSHRGGWTCFDLLGFILVFYVPIFIGFAVGERSGRGWGIATYILLSAIFLGLCIGLSIWAEKSALKSLYPAVYRVLSVPKSSYVRAEGVEIRSGDYGWEASPIFRDGRVYLHGLTEGWCVAWYAGFEPHQIEWICQKPHSQYSLPDSWFRAGDKPSPCPYPVLQSPKKDLGKADEFLPILVQRIHEKSPASGVEIGEN